MATAPLSSPHAQREAALAALRDTSLDLLVIGGGITGCGIARDAALRGLKVGLVEQTDFAAGTSSKSSKLVHGGLRYLERLHLKLVFEGVNERALLQKLAPHLVRPLPFLFPSYKGRPPGLFTLDVGLWLYDALCKFTSYRLHRTYRARKILSLEPGLRAEALVGAVIYYDSLTDDARLTLETAIDARELGAAVVSYARAVGLLKDESGRITGAEVEDAESPGAPFPVRAKVVVNATGPWSDEVRSLAGDAPILKASKGVHLVVDAKRLPLRHAVVMLAPSDRRVMFAIPWGERTVLGTTDTFYEGPRDKLFTTREDADYVLAAANHHFPDARLSLDDVVSTWAGLRPLIAPEGGGQSASAISREHLITDRPGFVTIAGGKLTTYRRIAEEVVDHAARQLGDVPRSSTGSRPLPGARGLDGEAGLAALAGSLVGEGVDLALAQHLVASYGSAAGALLERVQREPRALSPLVPGLPYVLAEVDEAIDRGFARTLTDVLARRVPLLLRSADQGRAAAPRVAEHLARRLGWSEVRVRRELAAFQVEADAAVRFRTSG